MRITPQVGGLPRSPPFKHATVCHSRATFKEALK